MCENLHKIQRVRVIIHNIHDILNIQENYTSANSEFKKGSVVVSDLLKKGQKFNMLTVIKPVKVYKADGIHYTTQYLCKCDCGNTVTVRKSNLTRTENPTKSCGCLNDKNRRNHIDDLKGQRFGKLLVLYRAPDYIAPTTKAHRTQWHCRCDCGVEKDIDATVLKTGKVVSCGCHSAKLAHDNKYLDLQGQRFGKLTVISPAPPRILPDKNRVRRIMQWNCRCDCGNTRIASTTDLRSGDAHSCGCDSLQSLRKQDIMNQTIIAANGLSMRCIDYHNTDNIDIQFEDNEIVTNIRSKHFEEGNVKHPAFTKKLNAPQFHDYKNLKPAFRFQEHQYYYCITPENKTSIVKIQDMIDNQPISPFIGQMLMNPEGLWMTVINQIDDKLNIIFEDGMKLCNISINQWTKNTIHHPIFSTKSTCDDFYGFKNVSPAFITSDVHYYYCTPPNKKTTIMSLQEMLFESEQIQE